MNRVKYTKQLLTVVLALISFNLSATNLYWIGGTGNWSDPNHWSTTSGGPFAGGLTPTSADNVYFDANSFTGAGQSVSASGMTVNCLTMDWTGVTNTPNFDVFNATIYINGSLILNPSMTLSSVANNYFYFISTSTGNVINTYGLTLPNSIVFFDGVNGEWTLQNNLIVVGADIYLTTGNLYSNGYTINVNSFQSTGSGIRGLSLVNSTVNCGASWIDQGTNFSIDATNSTINLTGLSGTFHGGTNEYNDLNYTNPSGTYVLGSGLGFHNVTFNGVGTISASNAYFNIATFMQASTINGANNSIAKADFRQTASVTVNTNFDTLKASPGAVLTLTSGTTQTVNTFQIDGTCSQRVTLGATVSSPRPTITCFSGNITMNYLQFGNINFNGGANFVTNNSIDWGNNAGITINAPVAQTLYWRGGSGNWTDPSHWSTTSGGAAGSCIPTMYDNVVFDANSFSGLSKTMTINSTAYCKNMTWTGTISNAQWAGSAIMGIYGSLTLASNMNRTFTGELYFLSSTQGNTITMSNKTLAANVNFDGTGSWVFQDMFNTTTGNIYLKQGTLNTNGKNVFCTYFYSNYLSARQIILGSSLITITGDGNGCNWDVRGANLIINPGTSTIKFTSSIIASNLYSNPSDIYYNVVFQDPIAEGRLRPMPGTQFHNVTFYGPGWLGNVTFPLTSVASTYNSVDFKKGSSIYDNHNIDSLFFSSGSTNNLSVSGYLTTLNIGSYLSMNGTAGNLTQLTSSGSYFYTINKSSSCSACFNYIDLHNSIVGGGGAWYAANSTDSGNNTGWNFAACPSTTLTVGPITGPANTCVNGTNYTYSIPAVSGGTYVWSVPAGATILSGQGTNSIYVSVGSTAGTVSVTVTACGNTASATKTITVNVAPTITNISVTPATCNHTDGSATATVTGGTPTYFYRWSSGDTLATAPALAAGQYQLVVFDSYGCRATANTSIVASDGPSISVVSTTPTSCYGGANGTAQVAISGGVAPYVTLWSNGASTLTTTGLTAGPYEVTVTDANECVAVQQLTITSATQMTNTFVINPSACAGSTGDAQANVTGGTGAYTYLWDGAAANQTTQTATTLAAGVYQVTVKDANLCQVTFTATVPNTATTLASSIGSVVSGDCGPNSAGSATMNATGGVPSYTYLWSNGANTATITGVAPGNYYCTVTDASLCSSSQSVTITSNVGNITQAICMVTVDTSTFTNQVIWEKTITHDIQSFKIYRESSTQNVYTAIATIPYSSISEYTDPVANPAVHGWRYKISAIDSCGVETPYSAAHKTIHLAQNLGVGGEINLAWDQYEGFTYYSYYIWRYDPSTGWLPLDTLSTNYTTYTDFTPPSSNSRYMVEVRPQAGCTSTMRLANGGKDNEINTVVVKSKSNVRNNRTTGIKSDINNLTSKIKVYPNPATDMLNVEFLMQNEKEATITIENMLGQVVYTMQTNKPINSINTTNLMKGVYFVKVNTGKGSVVEKVIIE